MFIDVLHVPNTYIYDLLHCKCTTFFYLQITNDHIHKSIMCIISTEKGQVIALLKFLTFEIKHATLFINLSLKHDKNNC